MWYTFSRALNTIYEDNNKNIDLIKTLNSIKGDTLLKIAIDLGIDNFATITNNIGLKPIAIKGKVIKSYNQYYNKKAAFYKSKAKKFNNLDVTNRILRITNKRNNKLNDYIRKIS